MAQEKFKEAPTRFELLQRKARRAAQVYQSSFPGDSRTHVLVGLMDNLLADYLEWPEDQWSPDLRDETKLEFFNDSHRRDTLHLKVQLRVAGVTVDVSIGVRYVDRDMMVYLGNEDLLTVNVDDAASVAQFCEGAGNLVELQVMKALLKKHH